MEPWSPESPPCSAPHIHAEETEDFASAESQSVRDTDDFRTPDSEHEGSTDVSNPYRNIPWTAEPPRTTQTEVDAEAEPGEEGPTSAFPDSRAPHPSRTPDPVTMIGSRGERVTYHELNEADYKPLGMYRTTPSYHDSMSEFEDDDAQEEVEEEISVPPNPTNVPTPGYRPVRDRSSFPPDSRPVYPIHRQIPRIAPIHHLGHGRTVHVGLLGTAVLSTEHQTPTFKRLPPPDQRTYRDIVDIVEMAVNNAPLVETDFSPYYLTFGYHPTFYHDLPEFT